MSREIKFRAWHEQKKVMHNNFQRIRSGTDGNDWVVFTSDLQPLSSKPHPFDNPHFSQQLIEMECTGLKDANGVEIYEGDIIAVNRDGFNPENLLVTFFMGSFCYSFPAHRDTGAAIYPSLIIHKKVVIGNIYQNPELLP